MNRALASGPLVWAGIILTTCLLLVLFQTALWLVLPVLLAVVSYYVMSPLVNSAMAHGLSRSRAVFIVTALMSIVLISIGMSLAPKVARIAHSLPVTIPEYIQEGSNLIGKAETTLYTYFPFLHHASKPAPGADTTSPNGAKQNGGNRNAANKTTPSPGAATSDVGATSSAEDVNQNISALTDKYSGDIALELLHWVPSLLLIPYLTYFFLLDGPRFKRFIIQAIPNAFFEKTLYLFYRVEDQLRRYFQGLLTLTALDALCLGIGLWFLGINSPFLLAIVAAVMAWLPYLGSLGGGLLVVLVAAHHAPGDTLLPYEVVGLFIAVRLLDDFFFLPLTVGRSLHMHPLVTVLMILLGGAVAGISGLLLVMPVLGVVMVAGQIIGELIADDRIIARHRHARELGRLRAKADL